jgi:hypothetical protein
MKTPTHDEHGSRCSCRILAETVGCKPEAIAFSFCQAVLMKRWVVECNHGCMDKAPASKLSSKLLRETPRCNGVGIPSPLGDWEDVKG